VVEVGVQIVDSNSVDTKNLQQGGVTAADLAVRERILAVAGIIPSASTDLVGHTNNLKLIASVGVDKAAALDGKCRNSSGERGAQGDKSGLKLFRLLVK
jgi:hypothetical protein